MAYEVFQRTSVRVDVPALSIVPGGKVAINAAACRLLTEANITTVVILWDKAKNKMAIKSAPKGEKNSFTITFAADRHSGSFKAKSFFDHIGWRATERAALTPTWNASEKMLEVVLPAQYVGAQDRPKRSNFI